MVKSVVGIPAANSSDLSRVIPKVSPNKVSLTEGEKEAILLVLLGLIFSLKGDLSEKIIEDISDDELRGILSPVQTSLQASAFSWLLNTSDVRELLLSEFKKKKELEEKKKREEEAKAKLRIGTKFTRAELLNLLADASITVTWQQDGLGLSFTLDGRNYTWKRQGDLFIKQSFSKIIKENKMGKKFALKSATLSSLEATFRQEGDKPFNAERFYYYFRDWVGHKLEEDNPSLDEDEFSWYDDHVLDDYSEDAWYDEENPPSTMKSAAEELWQLMGEDIVERLNSMFETHFKTNLNSSKSSSILSEKYWFLDRFDKPKAYQNLTKDELISKIKETLYPLKNETDEQWVLTPDWDSLGADADTVSWGRMGHDNENGAGSLSWEEVQEYLKNSKEKNMRKFAIKSARGEVSDSTRQLVRDILDQVPALVKVPAKQQGIKKEPYGPDHVCYYYTEEGPRKGSYVTVEFHVDPNDLYTDIFITTRASFAAAADGGEARQDEREITLDEFVIEDLEDYSLADIDKIDAAVTKGFEGAQKFDEQAASTIESRKAIFSSKHKKFVSQDKKGKIYSEIPGLARYIQEIMDEEGVTREEAEEIARERISIGL